MKNVQIPQELFMKRLRYHLLDDDSCTEDVKKGLEQKMKNGKKPDRSIWTGGEYRLTFDGNSSLNAI